MFCYLIIAILIAAVFTSNVFYPELKDAIDSGTDNVFTRSQGLTISLVFAATMLLAPIAYVVVLMDGLRVQVRKGISQAINED